MHMPLNPTELFNRYLSKILPTHTTFTPRDKVKSISDMILYMLNRTSRIFEWRNLPDTIPSRMLELYLQTNGNVAIYEHENALYAFTGGLGGEPDPYYMPTIYTIANPALQLSVNARIHSDCVVIPSDSLYIGLLPMISKYATLIAENELTLYVNMINARVPYLVGADSGSTADAANALFKDVEAGKMGAVATNQFFDGLKSVPYSATSSHTLTDLLEIEQYLRATLYNELGLQSNYNMKREHLTDDETALNETTLLPLIDDMLYCRRYAIKEVNAMWGTSISVDLSSGWKLTQDSARAETDMGGDDDETAIDNT